MNKILVDKYFSTTDLKVNTKRVLEKAHNLGEIIVMNNNKPSVVIMTIDKYNYIQNYYIPEIEPDNWEKKALLEYSKNKKENNLEFIENDDVFTFLDNLK